MSEQQTGSEAVTIDVREMPPRQRHTHIFEVFDGLDAGTAMRLVNDHDPKPLYYQLAAERKEELGGWDYLEEGPETWQVRISKSA